MASRLKASNCLTLGHIVFAIAPDAPIDQFVSSVLAVPTDDAAMTSPAASVLRRLVWLAEDAIPGPASGSAPGPALPATPASSKLTADAVAQLRAQFQTTYPGELAVCACPPASPTFASGTSAGARSVPL